MCSQAFYSGLLLGFVLLLVILPETTYAQGHGPVHQLPWRCDTSSLLICPDCSSDINSCNRCELTPKSAASPGSNVCASCSVALRSWTFDDNDTHGFIKINGQKVFDSYVPQNAPLSVVRWRGIILAVLDVISCSISNVYDFDTFINAYDSNQMIAYINALSPGTVLLAITADEPSASLTPDAVATLVALGFQDAPNIGYRYKFAFLAVIGHPRATIYGYNDNMAGNLNVALTVEGTPSRTPAPTTVPPPTTTTPPPGSCTIDLLSWGSDDSDTHGYMKTNGITVVDTYVPKNNPTYTGKHWRGVIIATLDIYNCTLYNIRDFDTFAGTYASQELVSYINAVPDESYIVAITADEASNHLSPAIAPLQARGFTTVNYLGFRWKFVFVIKIGSPSDAAYEIKDNNNGNLYYTYTIPGESPYYGGGNDD